VRGKKTIESVYAITSLSAQPAGPQQLLALSRAHWGIKVPPRHPAAQVPGWTRFPPAQDWLAQHTAAGTASAATQARFNQFLAQTNPAVSANLTDAAKRALFQQFLTWDKAQPAGR
jgi:hypothetical protein